MLNQDEQLLKDELPETITEEMIDKLIVQRHFQRLGRKTMICCLVLKNGFEVIGTASCVVEQKFDADIGMEISEKNAKEQIWQLQGYSLQQLRSGLTFED